MLWQSEYRTHPPLGGSPTARGRWEPLHGGQGSISLEYQTYTSAYLFDTLATGLMQASNSLPLIAVQDTAEDWWLAELPMSGIQMEDMEDACSQIAQV